MGRVVIWCVILLGIGALTWCLFGGGDDLSAPGYGPMADYEDDGALEVDGPGLVGRDGGPVAVVEIVSKGKASIHGVVLGPSGTPLAGIVVTAAPTAPNKRPGGSANKTLALGLFKPLRGAGRVVAETSSAADGVFELTGLKAGTAYSVTAKVDAPLLASSQTWTANVGKSYSLRVFVIEGSPFRGRVVDADGKGVQGWVSATSASPFGDRPWLSASWRPPALETRSDGRFSLAAVPNGTITFSVHVAGRGARSGIRIDTPIEGEVDLAFEDPSGATLEGRVLDTAGGPIAGAKISVKSGPEANTGVTTSTARAVVSGKDGSFKVDRLTPGLLLSVYVHAEGYVPSGLVGRNMPLPEEKSTHLDIKLAKGATISGRVLDPDGTPIEGAGVQATRMGQGFGNWFAGLASTVSAADGTYTLHDVALGSGLIQATLDGHYMPPSEHGASNPWPWMQNAIQGTPYEAGDEGQTITAKDVTLAKGTEVTGLVVDEAGEPLAGVDVTAAKINQGWNPGRQTNGNLTARSDAEGRFMFPGLEPDKSYNLTARSLTHQSEKAEKVTVPAAGTPMEDPKLVAKLGATITGVVTETGGGPVAGVVVTVSGGTQESAVTGPDGAFELAGIKEGSWWVSATGVNPIPEDAKKKVDFVWGKTAESVSLAMPPVYTIRGAVEDEMGKLLAGIRVRAMGKAPKSANRRGRRRGGTSYYATTNTKGTFELRGLPEGEFTLWAGSAKEESISSGAEDVRLTLTLPDRFTVEGRVLDEENNPVARGSVRIYTGPTGKRRSSTNAPILGGYFSARVTTSESSVDIDVASAFDAAGRPVNFVSRREKDVSLSGAIELRLDAGHTISGKVVDGSGRGLPGMQVRIQKKGNRGFSWWGNSGGGNGGQARSGEDGSWKVGGLKQGGYNASLTPGGSWTTPEPVPVRADDTEVIIKLMKGLTIEGRILSPEGAPLPGANVWMTETAASKKSRGGGKGGTNWFANMRLRARAGSDGHFVIKGLPEDALFNVSAGGSGGDQAYISETIKDVAAGTKTVELRLRAGVMIEGVVVGPGGEAITNGWVQATPVDKKSGLKAANGRLNGQKNTFKVGPLMPGRYKLTVNVQMAGYASPAPMEIDAPAKGVRLVATKTASISGSLSGSDVQGFTVMFASTGGTQSGRVGADGSWTINNAKGATGTLFASKKGDDRYAKLGQVEPGRGPFHLTLQVGESIEGSIEGWSGEGRKPNVYCMAEGRWIQATVSDDGTFSVVGLAPGRYNLQGWINGGRIETQKDVESGSTGITLVAKMN